MASLESLRILKLAKELDRRTRRDVARGSLEAFVRAGWETLEPGMEYKHGRHISVICEHLEAQAYGDLPRLAINIPPGCMKSLLCSVFYPAWVWTWRPESRWLCTSFSNSIAYRDADKMRALIKSPWYQELFGDQVTLVKDASEKFTNTRHGYRISATLEGKVTGEGGNFIVIDDPIKALDVYSDPERNRVNATFGNTIATRQRPPGSGGLLLIMQRLHHDDPTNTVLKAGWHHLCLPMEYESRHPYVSAADWRKQDGELLFPEMFGPDELATLKNNMPSKMEQAGQLQQRPSIEGGGILREEYWQKWEFKNLPQFDLIIQSWDTAHADTPTAAESACTTWGLFGLNESEEDLCLMLIDSFHDRLAYPDLLAKAKELVAEYEPNYLLIERMASGFSLDQEMTRALRGSGTAVVPIRPKDVGSKVVRAQVSSAIFESERVFARWNVKRQEWMPEATAVIEQCAQFPNGKLMDMVDSVTQAVNWARKNNIVKTRFRMREQEELPPPPRKAAYG